MSKDITVSVIIPIYNMEKYLRMCLDSVVHQTLKNMEIILIDDGSTDSTPQIIREYQEKYADQIVVITKKNGGQGSARNLGIAKSRGEYIGFVDADDEIEHSMYEQMYQLAQQKNLDFVECNYRFIKLENGKEVELPRYGVVKKRENCKQLFVDPLVSPWNKLYRGDLLRDNQIIFPEGVIYEDTSFYIKTIPYINTFDYIDEAFVKHFYRQGSTMTGSKSLRVADIFKVLQDTLDFYNKKNYAKNYWNELEYFCIKILLCSSMDRISAIQERELRIRFVNDTWSFIKKNFPEYRKNPYLGKGKKNLYMKYTNRMLNHILLPLLKKVN